jgi:thiamine kinase-like enzyme
MSISALGVEISFLYVDGTVIGTHPTELAALAQMLGRLHRMPVDESRRWANSRDHPDMIATAAQQLAAYREKVPEAFRPLVTNLHAAMITLQRQIGSHLRMTHGDCWPMNAIKTRVGDVVLIDWDQSGLGLPLLDLGNLLLSSHFDLNQPLHVEVGDSKIKAIKHGYQQQNSINVQDGEHVANTMRFLLAWQLGSYIADDTLFLRPDFQFVLQKLQARYDATRDIADIAIDYIR